MFKAYFLHDVKDSRAKQKDGTYYVLAVDPGISFTPRSVLQLFAKLEPNSDAGAVAGRIYPTGHGENNIIE